MRIIPPIEISVLVYICSFSALWLPNLTEKSPSMSILARVDYPVRENSGVDTVSSPIEEQSIVIFPPTLMELYSAIFPLMPPEFISNVRSCASVMELPKVNDIFAPFSQVIDREFKFKSVPLTAITVTPETIPL